MLFFFGRRKGGAIVTPKQFKASQANIHGHIYSIKGKLGGDAYECMKMLSIIDDQVTRVNYVKFTLNDLQTVETHIIQRLDEMLVSANQGGQDKAIGIGAGLRYYILTNFTDGKIHTNEAESGENEKLAMLEYKIKQWKDKLIVLTEKKAKMEGKRKDQWGEIKIAENKRAADTDYLKIQYDDTDSSYDDVEEDIATATNIIRTLLKERSNNNSFARMRNKFAVLCDVSEMRIYSLQDLQNLSDCLQKKEDEVQAEQEAAQDIFKKHSDRRKSDD